MLKGGDVIFTYSNSWLSRKIFWFSKWYVAKEHAVPISHAALYLGKVNGIPYMAEAGGKGIKVKAATKYLRDSGYIVYAARLKNFPITESRLQKLRVYAIKKSNEDYAFLQVAAHFFKRVFGLSRVGDWDKDAMICSEFVAEAFWCCFGERLVEGKESCDVNPLEIYLSKNMEKVGIRWLSY